MHKYFKPKEFEIEKNYVENEIYHYSVEDDDIKNYITGKIPINCHLISASLIYNKPYVTMLVQEGTDLKGFYRTIIKEHFDGIELMEALHKIETEKFMKDLKNVWSDKEGAKKDFATIITLARFDWNKLYNVVPDEQPDAYQNCFEWYEPRISYTYNTIIQKSPPKTHLKRWVWLPSYFNFFIRNKRNKSSKIKDITSTPWTRNNWVYDKKEKSTNIDSLYT